MSFKDFTQNNSNGNNTNNGGMPMPPNISAMSTATDDDVTDLLIDYATFATMEPTLFRDGVISQLMSVLIGKDKPNALLVGEAGVGKTRIVEELARMIANKDPRIPDQIKDAHIWELPLSNIVSGSSFVGQLEEKLDSVLDFAADPNNDVILFIDEIHQLASRDTQTYGKIGQLLKPALARGEIRVIGATTLQEAQDLHHDPAFSRRFTRVIVDELTREQTVEILKNAWPSLCTHYQNLITVNDEVFETVARIADLYATAGQHRPDNAMTLMDRACADVIVERKEQLAILDPIIAKALAAQPLLVTESKATRCARKLATGQTKQIKIDFNLLDDALSEIKGQDNAISEIRKKLQLRELGLFPQTKPLTILCAGPSGVGKSAVARIIADQITGQAPITLNMAEFVTYASLNRIVGSPAGYVGSDSHTELPFDVLESNPYQVILLDEMEKSCREVQRFFMSAFDDGYCRTNSGKIIDFSKCVFFVTTNANHTTGATRSAGFSASHKTKTHADPNQLSKWFDIELLNRFQLMLTFNEISKDTYRLILASKYDKEAARINAEQPKLGLEPHLNDDELDQLCEDTYVREFGARPAERTIRQTIEQKALNLVP